MIEILVTIAVIAVLATILIPFIGNARNRALSTKSASNLRQSGSYLLLLGIENGNEIDVKVGGSGAGSDVWANKVANLIVPDIPSAIRGQQSVPALDILYCPTFYPYKHDPIATPAWSWATFGLFAANVGSEWVRSETVDNGDGSRHSRLRIPLMGDINTAKYPLLMDSVSVSMNPPSQRMTITTLNASTGVVSPHMRHNGMARAVFLDGSVRTLDQEALKRIGFTGAIDENLRLVSF